MANKKAVTTAKKTKIKAVETQPVAVTEPAATYKTTARRDGELVPERLSRIVIAELVGTFLLTLVALMTIQESASLALYVGLVFAALSIGIGAVSGAHLNPAVTFGLWTMKKVKNALVPFYWAAQLLGGMLAVFAINWIAGDTIKLNFENFTKFDSSLFAIELIGAAVFMMVLVAARSRATSSLSKAFGAGLALTVGLLVSGSLLANIQSVAVKEYQAKMTTTDSKDQKAAPEIPREVFIRNPTLNPAIALASTEKTQSQLTGQSSTSEEKQLSRIGYEVIFGTFIGAALGGWFYVFLARNRDDI